MGKAIVQLLFTLHHLLRAVKLVGGDEVACVGRLRPCLLDNLTGLHPDDLVVFHAEDVVRAGLSDFLGDLRLAAHRVNGDGGSLQVECLNQLWKRCNLVAFVRDHGLRQCQLVLRHPRAHDVYGIIRHLAGRSDSFPVNARRHVLRPRHDGGYPFPCRNDTLSRRQVLCFGAYDTRAATGETESIHHPRLRSSGVNKLRPLRGRKRRGGFTTATRLPGSADTKSCIMP